MALKNIIGRGVGFGPPHWITTHGYSSGAPVVIRYGLPPGIVTTIDLVPSCFNPWPDPTIGDPSITPTIFTIETS